MVDLRNVYEQVLASGQRFRPASLACVRINLPEPTIAIDPSEGDDFANQLFDKVELECDLADAEWKKGRQGARLRNLTGFPLLEKYLGSGAIWLVPSQWSPARNENWVVISPAAGAFPAGGVFEQ